ncbi:MAG: sigma 54-interacting transcriptional regulator [Candidatus Krumholzibacteria bacterium]|nr:sigma 54-interacting transcriptional regulator [Candidatus Krumholzibacteria bacterium]
MAEVTELISKIEAYVDKEDYRSALSTLDRSDWLDLADIPSAEHRDLSLLLARALYNSCEHDRASSVLDTLLDLYPDIRTEKDYIFLKSQILIKIGDPSGAEKLLRSALRDKRCREDEFFLRFCLGKACFWKGDYLSANLLLEACRQYYLSSGDRFMLGNVLYMLGYTSFQRSFFEQAEEYYNNATDCFNITGDGKQLAATCHMMGILLYRTGKYREAEELLIRSGKSFETLGDTFGMAESQIARARVNMYLGKFEDAERLLRRAYRKARESGYRRGEALAAEFLGETALKRGDRIRARQYLVVAEKLALEIAPSGDIAAEVYRRLGDLNIACGNFDEAKTALEKSMKLTTSLHDDYELGCVLRAFARLEAAMGNYELSISYFNEGISILRMINESFELASTCESAAEALVVWARKVDGDGSSRRRLFTEARIYATEAAYLYQSIGLEDEVSRCDRLTGKLLNESWQEEDLSGFTRLKFDDEWLREGSVVARSDQMRHVVEKAVSLASSTIPVLITGETGTGKEVVARLLHGRSDRAGGPFVAINCASITESVFESELFGHRKGAFTGADRDRVGIIERASGGTLFLDEISELSVSQQAKLLRFFQEQKIRRVGESRERPVDVRLVSATNQNVESLLRNGGLRKDFYYRVLTASIELEPLRRRKEDIEALFSWYMKQSGCDPLVENGLVELLKVYHWPGNVRQLISVVKILAIIGKSTGRIGRNDLPVNIRTHYIGGFDGGAAAKASPLKTKDIPSIGLVRDPREIRSLVVSSLVKTNGNKSAAARELGVSRSTFYRVLKEMDIF